MYTVYKAHGPVQHTVYIGYVQGDEQDALRVFTSGATRPEHDDRAERRLLEVCNISVSNVQITVIDVFNDEFDAWMCRNEQRAIDGASITGPTMFPGNIAERANKEQPEKVAGWKKLIQARSAKTARSAWNLGLWSKDVVKSLVNVHGRDSIVKDLDILKPSEFATKYALPF